MPSSQEPVKLPPETPPPRRWRLLRRVYVVCSALLAGVLIWWLHGDRSMESPELMESAVAAGVILASTVLAFRLARLTSMDRLRELRARVELAQQAEHVPELPATGWSEFDNLSEAMTRWAQQMEARALKAEALTAWYQQLAEDSIGIEAYFSRRGRLLWLSPSAEKVTGYSQEESFASSDIIDLWIYQKDRALMKELARRGLGGEAREDHELRVQHRDGTLRWFSCRWIVKRDADGKVSGIRFSAQDIQRRKDVELKLLETVSALRRAQALKEHYLKRSNDEKMRLSSLLDTVEQGILFVDRDRRVVYINQRAVEIWELGSRDSIVGTRDMTLIDGTHHMRINDEAYMRHVEEVVASRQDSDSFDILMRDGRIIQEVSAVVPAADGGKPIGRVWVFEDVTIARQVEQRLTELAERDPLTGLYNRRRFHEEIERLLADSHRREEQVGLISFDLDGFKAINDTFGHQAGDEVLRGIAHEVGSIVRRNELFFRLGGDEFAILAANTDTERMEQLARRVLARAGEQVYTFDGTQASVTVSVGIATAPTHAQTADSLVAAADRAMYRAKARGKNCCEVAHSPEKS